MKPCYVCTCCKTSCQTVLKAIGLPHDAIPEDIVTGQTQYHFVNVFIFQHRLRISGLLNSLPHLSLYLTHTVSFFFAIVLKIPVMDKAFEITAAM